MNEAQYLDVMRDGIFVMLKIAAPTLIAGLVVGLIIALFQALTQIQEMTLTFVPKIAVVFLTLIAALPFMLHTLVDFTHRMMDLAIATR